MCKQIITIIPKNLTRERNEEYITAKCKEIAAFAETCNTSIDIGYSDDGELIAEYIVRGMTQQFCKGVCTEIKEMFKTKLNAKITVNFYAY